ncbi:InlB B-repeat-containing protein [Lachnobacterium bovis]|uniref:Listeria/Bacterioides repeat-containing protein n=1 Tax=Lachnobacterium bovis DSM 14045 TaxID=1122142 RepID=A0A1H3H9B6_9FIRM|nr:InlB B-repeat-containing protein [Lachnobacterium bovis]SDY11950.1 Listeria/Bacterioides repeat-containing protein [Lachnobacterium bovis DSM 14045]
MLRKKVTAFLMVATMGVGALGMSACGTDSSKADSAKADTVKDGVKVEIYNVDGKTKIETLKVKSGEKVNPKEPKKDGYKFIGWYLTPDHTRKADLTQGITENTKLYAGLAQQKEDTRTFYIVGNGKSDVLKESNWGKVMGDAQKLEKKTVNGENEYTITLNLKAGDQFQFALDGKWSDQRGYGYLAETSKDGKEYFKDSGSLGDASVKKSNIEVKEDGKYTFTLKTYPADDYYDKKDEYYKESSKENFNLNPYDTITFDYSAN